MLIDAIFTILVIVACIKGYSKGLIIALFSLAAFFIGLAAALKLSAVVAVKLAEHTGSGGKWLPVISFAIIFIIVVLLVNTGGKLLQKTAEMIMLGWLNKLAGICFYLLIYMLIFSIFLFYGKQVQLLNPETIKSSITYTYIEPLAPGIFQLLGSIFPLFKGIFAELTGFFEGVSNKLKH